MYRNSFLDRKDLPTCLAPWHCLTVKWHGNVVPDIIYKGKIGNINKQSLSSILYGKDAIELREAHRNRTIPEVCSNCAKKEQSGRSRRMFFWDKLDFDVREASKELQVDSAPDIRYLDFTVSNKCNLACIHCDPFVSTGWTKDGKVLDKEAPEYWESKPIGFHGAEVNFMENLFARPEYFRNLQWVALRGGEPLYDERCLEILQWFVDAGLSHNIMLDISTNATVFKEEFKELFSKFKHVELLVSVEATDDLYSIVRGGKYKWEQLNENIEHFYEVPNDCV
jgi:MoaA/NifB/PqqE/SkfB family radical SAM enzyme